MNDSSKSLVWSYSHLNFLFSLFKGNILQRRKKTKFMNSSSLLCSLYLLPSFFPEYTLCSNLFPLHFTTPLLRSGVLQGIFHSKYALPFRTELWLSSSHFLYETFLDSTLPLNNPTWFHLTCFHTLRKWGNYTWSQTYQLAVDLCNPLQYSCLENFTDRGAWEDIVHSIAESDRTERLTLYALCWPFGLGDHPVHPVILWLEQCLAYCWRSKKAAE